VRSLNEVKGGGEHEKNHLPGQLVDVEREDSRNSGGKGKLKIRWPIVR